MRPFQRHALSLLPVHQLAKLVDFKLTWASPPKQRRVANAQTPGSCRPRTSWRHDGCRSCRVPAAIVGRRRQLVDSSHRGLHVSDGLAGRRRRRSAGHRRCQKVLAAKTRCFPNFDTKGSSCMRRISAFSTDSSMLTAPLISSCADQR
jgi:hypothetical protein